MEKFTLNRALYIYSDNSCDFQNTPSNDGCYEKLQIFTRISRATPVGFEGGITDQFKTVIYKHKESTLTDSDVTKLAINMIYDLHESGDILSCGYTKATESIHASINAIIITQP